MYSELKNKHQSFILFQHLRNSIVLQRNTGGHISKDNFHFYHSKDQLLTIKKLSTMIWKTVKTEKFFFFITYKKHLNSEDATTWNLGSKTSFKTSFPTLGKLFYLNLLCFCDCHGMLSFQQQQKRQMKTYCLNYYQVVEYEPPGKGLEKRSRKVFSIDWKESCT